jgi:hypothetical protein
MHDKVGNDVSSSPSSGHNDPVFATAALPHLLARREQGREDQQSAHSSNENDYLSP